MSENLTLDDKHNILLTPIIYCMLRHNIGWTWPTLENISQDMVCLTLTLNLMNKVFFLGRSCCEQFGIDIYSRGTINIIFFIFYEVSTIQGHAIHLVVANEGLLKINIFNDKQVLSNSCKNIEG